jgi:hypothetical protein
MNAMHEGPARGAVEMLEQEVAHLREARVRAELSMRRWRRGTLVALIGALALGVALPGGLRRIQAQQAPVAVAPAPDGDVPAMPIPAMAMPFGPVKVGNYYINIGSICYAYWWNQRAGVPASLVVEFPSAPRLVLNGNDANTLSRMFTAPVAAPMAPNFALPPAAPPVAPAAPAFDPAPPAPAPAGNG